MNQSYSIRKAFSWAILSLISIGAAWAQTGTVTGKVSDNDGTPLEGVEITWGSSSSAKTTADGSYVLELPGSYTLTASKESFESRSNKVEVASGAKVNVSFRLTPSSDVIGDVIIVGYGRQSRRNVVGSISSVSGRELTEAPAPSFEAALQGKAAGVQVTVGSGMAGSASLIRIRGAASISAAGDPLYVIDGIPVTQDYFMNRANGSNWGGGFNNNPLASINPEDIENIEILKDAAATSIYGSRGANGVILITTKRARKQGLKFDFNSRWSIAMPTARPDMLSGPEWLQLYEEAWQNDGHVGTPDLSAVGLRLSWDQAQNINTDWIDQMIGTGFKQSYNFSTNYKKDNVAVKAILSYDDNGSYVIGNNYNRVSERVNMDWKPMKKMNVQISHSLSQGTNTP